MIVIGIVGMPGAGKTLATEYAKEKGYTIVEMGDVLREEALRRYKKIDGEILRKLMIELRREGGREIVARLCTKKIKNLQNKKMEKIIICGIRSLEEVFYFRDEFGNFPIIAIHARPFIRYMRLKSRGREDDPINFQAFMERDFKELSVGIGNVIALADYIIINEGKKEEFRKKVFEVLENIEKGSEQECWLK